MAQIEVSYRVSQNGKVVAEFATEDEAFVYVLRAQGFSVDFATQHNGWSIRAIRQAVIV